MIEDKPRKPDDTIHILDQIAFYRDKLQLREHSKAVIESYIAQSSQAGDSLACMLFDLDGFYPIIQSLEPATTQEVLADCLSLLGQHTELGQAMSYGRDEFLVVIPNIRLEEAMFQAERLRTLLATMFATRLAQIAKDAYTVGCSAGIALYPDHAADTTMLLMKSREGLYIAKRQGRNLTKLPPKQSMVLKSNYYPGIQLERLSLLAQKMERTEASLLREALERFLNDYDI